MSEPKKPVFRRLASSVGNFFKHGVLPSKDKESFLKSSMGLVTGWSDRWIERQIDTNDALYRALNALDETVAVGALPSGLELLGGWIFRSPDYPSADEFFTAVGQQTGEKYRKRLEREGKPAEQEHVDQASAMFVKVLREQMAKDASPARLSEIEHKLDELAARPLHAHTFTDEQWAEVKSVLKDFEAFFLPDEETKALFAEAARQADQKYALLQQGKRINSRGETVRRGPSGPIALLLRAIGGSR